ncbi:LPS export ABC transporter permease LptF [Marinobacterium jannaschii]|uniref:LPS export ABC transporter permease LptF n=1 Tax=Marinobacterium jannaschii TaxID=64970 RepID=UPI0004858059|nr:LPS export ABC transporter permease LptF [Marinobacterium jannaschii]
MIVFRYLAREILLSMVAVTTVLLMIIMSGRFIKYLADAAAGEFSPSVLFLIMAYRLPGFLELILPLGLFLGILLGYGRLYLESEMTVLHACGMSERKLMRKTLGPALMVSLFVGFLSFYLSPLGAEKMIHVFNEQKSRSELEAITVGRFQYDSSGRSVSYTDNIDEEGHLGQVFVLQQLPDDRVAVTLAESGQRTFYPQSGNQYLVLQNGERYEGLPGHADYRILGFETYGVRMDNPEVRQEVTKLEALPTMRLLESDIPAEQAQLHWRMSIPVLVLIVSLLAVPLSKVNPRQGRYARLLPSILLYLAYLTLLSTVRSKVEDGETGVEAFWLLHAAFLLLAANMIFFGRHWQRLFDRLPSPFGWIRRKRA